MNFKLAVRRTTLHPAGAAMINRIKNGEEIIPSGDAVIIAIKNNRATAYLNTPEAKNGIGLVDLIIDEKGDEVIAQTLEAALKLPYKVTVDGLNEKEMIIMAVVPTVETKKEPSGKVSVALPKSDAVKRILSEGLCEKEELEDRVNALLDWRVAPALIDLTLEKYTKFKREVSRPKTIWKDPYQDRDVPMMQDILISILEGTPVNLIGEKGAGKNTAIYSAAWAAGRPVYMDTMGEDMTADDAFGGKGTAIPEILKFSKEEQTEMAKYWLMSTNPEYSRELTPEQLDMAAEYEALKARSATVQVVQEITELAEALRFGGVYVANEINLATANFLGKVMNQIADETGWIFIPGYGKIEISKDFSLIGAMNYGYDGTNSLNEATKDRFKPLYFAAPKTIVPQLKSFVEGKLGEGVLDDVYYTQVQTLHEMLHENIKSGVIPSDAETIRGYNNALYVVAKFRGLTTLKHEMIVNVAGKCYETEDRVDVMDQINNVITL